MALTYRNEKCYILSNGCIGETIENSLRDEPIIFRLLIIAID